MGVEYLRCERKLKEFQGFIPWTPMAKPLRHTTLSLVTSAGMSLRSDPPFDMEREKKDQIVLEVSGEKGKWEKLLSERYSIMQELSTF
jgi:hypothetical protein